MEGPKPSNVSCYSAFYRCLQNGKFEESGRTGAQRILEVFKAKKHGRKAM